MTRFSYSVAGTGGDRPRPLCHRLHLRTRGRGESGGALNKDKEAGVQRRARKQVCCEEQQFRSLRSEGAQEVTQGSQSPTVTWDHEEGGVLNRTPVGLSQRWNLNVFCPFCSQRETDRFPLFQLLGH